MNLLKIAVGVFALLPFCEIALAQTKPTNPKRWKKPIVLKSGREDVRCLENPAQPDPGGTDAIPGHSDAAEKRVVWATDICEHIGIKQKRMFTHYFDYDAEVWRAYPKGAILFPSFSEDDTRKKPAEQIYRVWKPDVRTCSLHIPRRNHEALWYTVCKQGCYPKGQRVKFDKGRYLDIADAVAKDAKYVTVIDRNSSLAKPRFTQIEVESYTSDSKPVNQELIEFLTASGKSIVVTPNHFLVTSNGKVLEAQLIKESDGLMDQFGKPETIVEIRENKDFVGRTYNVAPKSHDPLDNIVVAQGVLSGSHRYQTGTVSALNRKIGHNIIPANLLDDLN